MQLFIVFVLFVMQRKLLRLGLQNLLSKSTACLYLFWCVYLLPVSTRNCFDCKNIHSICCFQSTLVWLFFTVSFKPFAFILNVWRGPPSVRAENIIQTVQNPTIHVFTFAYRCIMHSGALCLVYLMLLSGCLMYCVL